MNAVKAKTAQLVTWIKLHRTRTVIGVSIFVVLVGGGVAYGLLNQKLPTLDITPIAVKKKPTVKYYSTLTGEQVDSEADLTKPVTAIMIENSTDARPQSGLKEGEVVYEAIAEGGITRLLVLYQQHKPQLIGPVRSVRPYYLDWVVPYDASIAHVGGSAQALSEVRNGNYRDIDQFFNAGAYWRANDRPAPHNVYTSFDKLDALNQAKGYTSSQPKGFSRTDTTPSKTPDATSVKVHISGGAYDSSYSYNASTDSYDRSQGGAPHTDREEGQISPKVVIVMSADYSLEFQDTDREVVQTTGSGPVKIFQNGTAIEGTWSRTSRDDQFAFTDANGNEVKLARGQTWITVIPSSTGSVSWQ